MTTSLSNLMPPVFYYLTNLVHILRTFGGSYAPAFTVAKSSYCWCFVCFQQIRQPWRQLGHTAQALAQWWHPVASIEALDVLHQAMRPELHHRTHMVIEVTSDSPALVAIADYLVAH
jgi:hypothetical protein